MRDSPRDSELHARQLSERPCHRPIPLFLPCSSSPPQCCPSRWAGYACEAWMSKPSGKPHWQLVEYHTCHTEGATLDEAWAPVRRGGARHGGCP